MADISNYLNQIKTAIKGEDVRGAIHDAIEACYTDGQWDVQVGSSGHGLVDKLARDKISALYDTSTGNVQETVLFDADTSGVGPIYCPVSIPEFSVSPSTFDYIYVYYKPVATAEPELHIYPVTMLADNDYKIVVTGVYPYDPGNDNSNKLLRVRRMNIQPIDVSDLLNWECYRAVVWEWDGAASNAASNYNVDGASTEANTYPAGQIVRITGVKYQSIATAVENYMSTHQFPSSGSGLTSDVKAALLYLAQQVMYINGNGSAVYSQLETALNSSGGGDSGGGGSDDPTPSASVSSISAVINQTGTVYDTDSLSTIRQYLTVTAHYSDSTSATITGYTLSGTLTAGTSTITISYSGKSTTVNVNVTSSSADIVEGTGWVSDTPYSNLTLVENSYYSPASYKITASSDGWKRTKYIDCSGATTVEFPKLANNNANYCFFFAEAKADTAYNQFVTDGRFSLTSAKQVTVPPGANYFMICGTGTDMDSFITKYITPRT